MLELLLIPIAVWCLVMTYAVGRLYTRPTGIPDDDVDLLRDLADRVRKLAATERRKAQR